MEQFNNSVAIAVAEYVTVCSQDIELDGDAELPGLGCITKPEHKEWLEITNEWK